MSYGKDWHVSMTLMSGAFDNDTTRTIAYSLKFRFRKLVNNGRQLSSALPRANGLPTGLDDDAARTAVQTLPSSQRRNTYSKLYHKLGIFYPFGDQVGMAGAPPNRYVAPKDLPYHEHHTVLVPREIPSCGRP